MILRSIAVGDSPKGIHVVDVGVETTQGERIDARLLFGREGFVVDYLAYQRTVHDERKYIKNLSDLDDASLEARDFVASLFGIETGIEEEVEGDE